MHNGRCFSCASSRRCSADLTSNERDDTNSRPRLNLCRDKTRQADVAGGGAVHQRGSIDDAADIQTPASLCLGRQSACGLSSNGQRGLRACIDRCARASCPAQITATGATSCGLGAPCTYSGKTEGARTNAIHSQIGISLRTYLKNTARTDLRSDPPAGLPLRHDQLLGASLRKKRARPVTSQRHSPASQGIRGGRCRSVACNHGAASRLA